MKPLFPAWTDSLFRLAIGLAIAAGVAIPVAAMSWVRSPYMTGQGEPVIQPIKFDHRHHVRDDGIGCVYCHSGAERSAYAGVPAISSCMNCHSQIWTSAPN